MRLHLPPDLVTKFGQLSQPNTSEKKETGGILAGVRKKGFYKVTYLIIPEQTGGPDWWEVPDVTQITNFFVHNPNLVMLWLIHTNPGMTSFMSSVDIHALWDYARDNPDLISIVLAPELGTSPAYSLTKAGIKEIANCKEQGFHHHEHDDTRYYKESDHVINDPTLVTEVIDFRLHA